MKRLAKIVGITLLFQVFALSCSSGKIAAKNSEPRQILIGKVIHKDHTLAQNALVSLFDVKITTNKFDSICKTYSTTTSDNGYFILKDIPDGNYLLYIYDTNRGKCNLSQIHKRQNSFQFDSAIVLEPLITLTGRIAGGSSNCQIKQVLIPGFGASAKIDEMGYFTLTEVPAGHYELALIGNNQLNYAPIHINGVVKDTVFLGDIKICSNQNTESLSLNTNKHF